MNRWNLASIALLLSPFCQAYTLDIVGPEGVIFQQETSISSPTTVGAATYTLLQEQREIDFYDFEASEKEVVSIQKWGPQRVENAATHELTAYGWCYELNGKQADKPMNEVALANDDALVWFYGTLQRDAKGKWSDHCEPTAEVKKFLPAPKNAASPALPTRS